MSMAYIRKTYGVPVKRGKRVRCKAWDGWCDGTIASADKEGVMVRPDPWPNARLRYHPTDTSGLIYP